jgi:hypothetical protein
MGQTALLGANVPKVPLPGCIIGCSGIYEFDKFGARHGRAHEEFLEGGLGHDRARWNDVAPVCFKGHYGSVWPNGLALLASSLEDGLVDIREMEKLAERLTNDNVYCEMKYIKGSHDEAWQSGKLGCLVVSALEKLLGLE